MPKLFDISLFIPLRKRVIGRIAGSQTDFGATSRSILISHSLQNDIDYSSYVGVLLERDLGSLIRSITVPEAFGLIDSSHTLAEGDVVAINPAGYIDLLYKKNSPHNSLFVTGRCNSNCLMCSQPPTFTNDVALYEENINIIELADQSTNVLGITGGEPTLLKDDLLSLINHSVRYLPNTKLHLLTNGRLLRDEDYVKSLFEASLSKLTIAIPIYSDIDNDHDHIVQAKNAFDQTIRGILNLARYKLPIELRIVIHKLNYSRLLQIAEFIYYNLTFVSHVAFMALEPIGNAVDNISSLWIDPYDYHTLLEKAVNYLNLRGIRTSVYNHQLCCVTENTRLYCRRSISDWKVSFLSCCSSCSGRNDCGGLFESAVSTYHSAYITPF